MLRSPARPRRVRRQPRGESGGPGHDVKAALGHDASLRYDGSIVYALLEQGELRISGQKRWAAAPRPGRLAPSEIRTALLLRIHGLSKVGTFSCGLALLCQNRASRASSTVRNFAFLIPEMPQCG